MVKGSSRSRHGSNSGGGGLVSLNTLAVLIAFAVAVYFLFFHSRTPDLSDQVHGLLDQLGRQKAQIQSLQQDLLVRSNEIAELERRALAVPAKDGECNEDACAEFGKLHSVPESWAIFLPVLARPPYLMAYPPHYPSNGINTHLDALDVPRGDEKMFDVVATILNTADATSGVVVDVGSGVGLYTLYAAAMGHHVYAFEPNQQLARLSQMAIVANAFDDRVRLVPAACGDEDSVRELYVPIGNPDVGTLIPTVLGDLTNVEREQTQVVILDNLLNEPIILLKIDVQGAEGKVLKGATEIVTGGYCKYILMELWPKAIRDAGDDVIGLLEVIMSSGYTVQDVYTGTEWTAANREAKINEVAEGKTAKPANTFGESNEARTDLLIINPNWEKNVGGASAP